MTALEVPVLTLDSLLRRICGTLRLSDALHALAEERYNAVAAWLMAPGSPFALANPQIYSQGSLRIGTTVRPRGRNEFDLDLVLELQLVVAANADPMKVLDAVERRLRESAVYRDMVERKNRCIRLNYSGEFHLDILPGVPNAAANNGAILVPDCEACAWKHSNPKGYAEWYEERRRTEEEHRRILDGLEPLPASASTAETPPLTRSVQLIKRWRDVAYESDPSLAPISIVLTTLSATHYGRQLSESAAIAHILACTVNSIPSQGRLVVYNPTNHLEDLSERWSDPKLYEAFVRGIRGLQAQWSRLLTLQGLANIVPALEALFGPDVVQRALRDEVSRLEEARAQQKVGIGTSGMVITAPKPERPMPKNTFYGDADDGDTE